MVNYRRARVPGATYFFTVTLKDRRDDLLVTHIDVLRLTFRAVRQQKPFRLDAIVVLPDHLHTIWTLPDGDADFSSRWQAIKARFTRSLNNRGEATKRNARGEFDIWQARYWEHIIRDDSDFERHVSYIHYNPVKHSLVTCPTDWRWSSVHRYIRQGLIPATWAVDPGEGGYGE